jgi:predicted ATPase/DNA-binding SARP family transcriptional activator
MASLKLWLLGPPRIEYESVPVEIQRRKAVALLVYLAVKGESQPRDSLATLLWPDSNQSDARRALRRDLSALNKALGRAWLEIDREGVGLERKPGLWLDVEQFQQLLAACRAHGHPVDEVCPICLPLLGEAVELYRADFLTGFTLSDSPEFDEWQFFEAESLRRGLASALERLVRGYGARGDAEREQAISYARRWLALDPLHEPAHQQLMQLYAWTGQQALALRQYQECVRLLDEELGVAPSAETTNLFETIKARRLSLPPPQAAARPSSEVYAAPDAQVVPPRHPSFAPLHTLPLQPTPFIGREAELTSLGDLIADPNVRLVTIVGLAGMGKTRLALAIAEKLVQSEHQLIRTATNRSSSGANPTLLFPNGVFFVSLAPLSAVNQIVPAIAQALDFRLETGPMGGQTRTPQQQLLDYLRQKRLLLIMDNFEHLLSPPSEGEQTGGAELLAEILQTVPQVQILATSRERLHLREEHIYPIQGLEFSDWETPEDAAEYTAVQLFLQSARRVRPNFELVADDLTYLTRICRLVEGMPLGIELAASWVELLPLADIAAEIQQSLDFLETEVRNIPERHRSIRAVFDTSWQQLSETERDILAQLSLFRGGFTRKAAQEVTGASLRVLATLSNKSLLRFSPSQERYEIHELLRQYGAHKLAEDPTKEAGARDRHTAYYFAALQQREIELKGDRQQAALAEIEADIQNARTAWDWAAAQRQCKRLEQAIDGFGHFYQWRGRYQEGEETCRLAVEQLAAPESGDEQRILAKVLAWQGVFNSSLERLELASQLLSGSLDLLDSPGLSNQDTRLERAFLWLEMGRVADAAGERQEARRLLEQSLALYQELNDQWGMANVLQELSNVAWNLGAYDESQKLAEECLVLRQGLGDRKGIARSLDQLGLIASFKGRLEESKQFLRESITIHHELGDLAGVASATGNLGSAFKLSGEFVQARDLYEQTVTIFSDLVVRHFIVAEHRAQVGHAIMHLGRYKEAKPHIQMGLKLAMEIGDQRPRSIALALVFLGETLLAEGKYAQAQERLQKGVTIYRAIGQQAELAWALSDLSLAAYLLGNISEAKQHAYEALQIASVAPTAVLAFGHAMAIFAYLLGKEGSKEEAVELYALASRYSYVANSCWFRDIIGQYITAAAATLPPEIVETAQARGQALDLWRTVAELLEALSERGW